MHLNEIVFSSPKALRPTVVTSEIPTLYSEQDMSFVSRNTQMAQSKF